MNSQMHSGRYRQDDEQVQEIRRRMATLRRELRGNVKQVGQSAQAFTDWRNYVRRYPWAAVAVAAALGFLLVPKRPLVVAPAPEDLAKLARREKIVVTNKREKSSAGLLGSLGTLAMTGAMRALMAYVGQNLSAASAGTSSATSSAPDHLSTSRAHPQSRTSQ